MAFHTKQLFVEDAYLSVCDCKVVEINDCGGVVLDQTNFYATSGGQPGDTGFLERNDGSKIQIATTVTGESKQEIILVPDENQPVPEIGEVLIGHIDWDRRYKLMQMHTACHLLSVVCPYPITGAGVNVNDSRVDFEIPEAGVSKEEISEKLMDLINENHPVFTEWITEEQLEAEPSIVRSKNVRPPKGLGNIRLVCIGDSSSVDSQPCGGTHVTETGEIGDIHIGKIEKKGRENRRFRIRFGPFPTQ
ncbi:MAG: alanyl-tRNA editing protein [Rhizobiaceae bacterium]|nr:alanyl-tRNA editing protein [Rhizobiaceae bacterium]